MAMIVFSAHKCVKPEALVVDDGLASVSLHFTSRWRRTRRDPRGVPLLHAVPVDVRSVEALRRERCGSERGDDERHEPAHDDLRKQGPVDASPPLKERDSGGGANLTVRGGQRDAQVSAHDDHDGGAELDAQAARLRDLGQPHADLLDDLLAVYSQPRHNP